uniref:procathepsin L-like n=1 Tax=Myxine glutinosa TaxID=7769 RepID=UPI00358EE9D2
MLLWSALLQLLLLQVTRAQGVPAPQPSLDSSWLAWKRFHGKHYTNNEDVWRRLVWERNLHMIETHNLEHSMAKHSFTMEMNHFGDMTRDEFRMRMNGMRANTTTRGSRARQSVTFLPPLNFQIPAHVDWRNKGLVTNVKDQKQCGSCWSFGATGALEGQWARRGSNRAPSLSEQNLMDCSQAQGNNGCQGGSLDGAFQYVIENNGIDSESSYPYEAKDGRPCRYRTATRSASATGLVDLPQGNERTLQVAVASVGPVAVAFDASHQSFQFYKNGIYYEPDCDTQILDHAVIAVGYGSEDGEDYWLVKNSWGEGWGDNGYVKIARNRGNHCGIASTASYPLV